MIDSKEALENLTYCVNGMESQEKYYKIIKQDLDKLEKLEKENQELQKVNEEFLQSQIKAVELIDKYKKFIEILKNKTVIIIALELSKDLNEYNRMTSFEKLTQEEYELLKDVLGNKWYNKPLPAFAPEENYDYSFANDCFQKAEKYDCERLEEENFENER